MQVFTKSFTLCALLCVMTSLTSIAAEVVVTTAAPSNVSFSSAKCDCKVDVIGNTEIREIGICWNTTGSPTIFDFRNVSSVSKTHHVATLEDLDAKKQYFFRGYAIANDSEGTIYYGNIQSFTTTASPIGVITVEPSKIEYTTVKCGVDIEYNNTSEAITKIGVCYSTKELPVHAHNYSNCLLSEYNNLSFKPIIYNLEPGKTYHVRAFAETKTRCFYGPDSTFTLKEAPKNAFLIDDNRFVYFSPGNLQYQASSKTWRFAAKQYDYVGENNKNISSNYKGWIDLFGWATSGYKCGKNNYLPYQCIEKYNYGPSEDLIGDYSKCDWGVFNPISNGGNQAGQWRTLSVVEWEYVLNNRANAKQKKIYCNINGKNGVILLPDNCQWPDGIGYTRDIDYGNTTYNLDEWAEIESTGAVFLPAAGYRIRSNQLSKATINSSGCYWTSSFYKDSGNTRKAYCIEFASGDNIKPYPHIVYEGCSVRLVKDLRLQE